MEWKVCKQNWHIEGVRQIDRKLERDRQRECVRERERERKRHVAPTHISSSVSAFQTGDRSLDRCKNAGNREKNIYGIWDGKQDEGAMVQCWMEK